MTEVNRPNQMNESALSLALSKGSEGAKSKDVNGGETFGTALNKALDSNQVTDMEPFQTNALQEIAPKNLSITNTSDLVSGKTGTLLDMLDSYISKLNDPNISLKNLAPDLENIKSRAGNLLKETQNLTEEYAGLKEIATHTIVTAQTEYLKFQRGDYLS